MSARHQDELPEEFPDEPPEWAPTDPDADLGMWRGDGLLCSFGVRIWGDPILPGPGAEGLRATLRGAEAAGVPVSLVLPPGTAERVVDQCPARPEGSVPMELTSGARTFTAWTDAGPEDRRRILAALTGEVGAHAPVVVSADCDGADGGETAALAWPGALVIETEEHGVQMGRIAAMLRARGSLPPVEPLGDWLALPRPSGAGGPAHWVHVATTSGVPRGSVIGPGTEALLSEWSRATSDRPRGRLTVLACDGRLQECLQEYAQKIEGQEVRVLGAAFATGLQPEDLMGYDALAQPGDALPDQVWRRLLASGRPLLAGIHPGNRDILLGRDATHHGCVLPVPMGPGAGGCWRPFRAGLAYALDQMAEGGPAIAARARRRAIREWATPRLRPRKPTIDPGVLIPAACRSAMDEARPLGARTPGRPQVVLESPLLEPSSAAELTIDTARAMLGHPIDLRLVPVGPFHRDLGWLHQRAPELVPFVGPSPDGDAPEADLWVTRSWPPRSTRPKARLCVWRIDQEYGAVPSDQMLALRHTADVVAVHSRAVEAMMRGAGVPPERLRVWPHGVDPKTFGPDGDTLPEVAGFRAQHPDHRALLFVGGLIWRKGVDRWLEALLRLHDRSRRGDGPPVCGVIKAPGGGEHYAGQGMEALVERVANARGGPPMLLLDRDMGRGELAALYRSCDALVHPYRGEGFGMPVLEARACGLPVVVSAGGSTDDFCSGAWDRDGSVRIDASFRSLDLPTPHVSRPWVLEPEPGSLVAGIQRLWRDPTAVRTAARDHAGRVADRNSWHGVARAVVDLAGFASKSLHAVSGLCTQQAVVPAGIGRISVLQNQQSAQVVVSTSS